MMDYGFEWSFLLRQMLFSVVWIGISIGIMIIAIKGMQKTGEGGWTFLMFAQIISLVMTVIGFIPSIFTAMGRYEFHDRFGIVFSGLSFVGQLATGVLTLIALGMILKAAVPKPPANKGY